MSVAAFLRLLLAPAGHSDQSTEILRSNHYFAIGHIVCAIKPFELGTFSIELPSPNFERDNRLWSLEPCGEELELLSKQGYSVLEEINKSSSDLANELKEAFQLHIDRVLIDYGKIRQENEVPWETICKMYDQLGKLGLEVTKMNEKWNETIKSALQNEENSGEIDSEVLNFQFI